MKKVLALLIVLAGAAGGVALGLKLRPAADVAGMEPEAQAPAESGGVAGAASGQGGVTESYPAPDGLAGGEAKGTLAPKTGSSGEAAGGDRDYVKLARQIIVPVVHERETQALMLFDLALDVPRGATEHAYAVEPRLRDAFLRELMDLSYSGAFLTTYTDDRVITELRDRLRAAARRILGDDVSDVLILDILRQEL